MTLAAPFDTQGRRDLTKLGLGKGKIPRPKNRNPGHPAKHLFGKRVNQDLTRKLPLFVDLPPARNLRCGPNGGFSAVHRAYRLSLPHPRKTRRRRDGCRLQS